MVVSKRKKDNKDVAPATPELKRTKIQAQRKFPQGQNPPASAYLSYNLASGNETPKEKSPEKELLPNLRPNTEDFLTFLCFRGTSSLPKELDFTNSLGNSQPSTSGTVNIAKIHHNEKHNKKQDKNEIKKKSNNRVTNSNNNKNNDDETVKLIEVEKKIDVVDLPMDNKKEIKKPFMPFAVRKRAEVHPIKNDKKRLLGNKKKQAQVSTLKDNSISASNENRDKKDIQNELRVTRSNPVEEKIHNQSLDDLKKGNKRKSQSNESSHSITIKNIKLDKSPRIELTPIEKVPIDILKKDSKIINVNKRRSDGRMQDEKRLTRLSSSKNLKNNEDINKKNSKKEQQNNISSSESSDVDNEPLIKSSKPISKGGNVNNKKKAQTFSKNDSDSITKTKANNIHYNISSVKSSNELLNSDKSCNSNKKKDIVQKIVENSKKEEKQIEKSVIVEKSEKATSVGKKNKTQKEDEKANSQANTTDLSENETRSRPMRKTKEAATIYMELIGRKLTLHDSSDNDSSLDSLEVPNLKRVELLENELKANVEKAKEAEAEKKRAEENKNAKKNSSKLLKKEQSLKIKSNAVKEDESKEKKKIDQERKFGNDEKLEKSFSDSDEEPLATKVIKQISKITPKKRGRKSNQELADIARKAEEQKQAEKLKLQIKELSSTNTKNENTPKQNLSQKKVDVETIKRDRKKSPVSEIEKSCFDEIKDNSLKLLKSQELKSFNKYQDTKIEESVQNDDEFVKKFDTTMTKPVTGEKPSINLLPSKEESEKIFGIASVTLAQSSGPLDTKCTLGKCGSIHKPPLGPAILTESALGASLSPKDRRKSKVNMTREQIQKWLDEASWTPIPDDEMESVDFKTTSKASTSSAILSKYGDDSQSSTLTKEKIIEHSSTSFRDHILKTKSESPTLLKQQQNSVKMEKNNRSSLNANTLKTEEVKKNENESLNIHSIDSKASSTTIKSPANDSKKVPIYKSHQSQLHQHQQKQQQQQRRTPVYKSEKPTKSKLTPILPSSFGAFSPENEHSIYSFDREDDDFPTPTTPFRRSNSKTDDNKRDNETPSKSNATPSKHKQVSQPSHVSLTLSPEDNKKSASISVIGLSDDDKKEDTKIDVHDKDDSDSEGHTFYIPLQASNTSGGSKTIQGVAVKLGTEGAEGPNQRIIMHAKLVTKSKINATPLPESMTNVQELVKTLMASKETTKPVQPVQPRFKSNEIDFGSNAASLQPEPSTSSLVANQRTKQPTKLGVLNEAPIFRPTEKEFQDPIEYIEKITPLAQRFGICRIIPPDNFKPECRVSDEMRFTAYNQYVHKMLHRWGPSAKEFSAIKKYLATQSIVFQRPPLIAGIEVDLPRLYHTVQELGGLKEVIEKKKWAKVAEDMCIPKSAHDRVTKLDDIYCKYLLPYDTLSPTERQKLFDEVEADWAKREAKARRNADKGVDDSDEQNDSDDDDEENEEDEDEDDNESMECMVKGRSMALSQFYRIARNLVTQIFKTAEPPNTEIETEYWRHVAVRDSHVCVHYGSIDSSAYGYGFPAPGPKTKLSPCAKHPWNLKVLTNNCGSILRSLGPVMGVTVPTLHVGMLFSAVCWYRDPHGLPWIEYLHTGASKIWYAVPDEQSSNFRSALTSLVPSHCQNKTIWLPCDTTMVPPYMLTDRNVSLCRTEQQPGQFVVVFPRAYTSSVCTGYTVSESVYFATHSWLDTAHLDFKDIQDSCEPMMFSLEQLLFAIANDQRSKEETIKKILPMLKEAYDLEKKNRNALKESGVNTLEKIYDLKNKFNAEELECNYCRANLHISWIKLDEDEDENNVYCLKHALRYINDNRIQANQCKLMYTHTLDEVDKLIKKLKLKVAEDVNIVGQSTSTDSHLKTKNKMNQKGKATNK